MLQSRLSWLDEAWDGDGRCVVDDGCVGGGGDGLGGDIRLAQKILKGNMFAFSGDESPTLPSIDDWAWLEAVVELLEIIDGHTNASQQDSVTVLACQAVPLLSSLCCTGGATRWVTIVSVYLSGSFTQKQRGLSTGTSGAAAPIRKVVLWCAAWQGSG